MTTTSKIKNLFSSIDDAKTWDAVITLPSSVWYRNKCGIVKPHDVPTSEAMSKNTEVDIMECIQKCDKFLINSSILHIAHGYPKDAAFQIEEFKGTTNEIKDSLIQFLKGKAREKGTELLARKQSNNKSQYHHYRFCCKHNLCYKSSPSKLKFDDKLQQPMTIEGREHQPPSKRHRSRSSHNTLSQCSPSQPRNDKRRIDGQKNKTSTFRAPTTETTCKFSFSVFCHKGSDSSLDPNDGNWYISFTQLVPHTYHLPLDPAHLTAGKNDLPPILNVCCFGNCSSESN